MARADKPKQATNRTREAQENERSPLADSADDANPADELEAVYAAGRNGSWRWHGTQSTGGSEGIVKGASGNKAAAVPAGRTPRRTRAVRRPAPPKGRVPR
jgi:hypothetical protein